MSERRRYVGTERIFSSRHARESGDGCGVVDDGSWIGMDCPTSMKGNLWIPLCAVKWLTWASATCHVTSAHPAQFIVNAIHRLSFSPAPIRESSRGNPSRSPIQAGEDVRQKRTTRGSCVSRWNPFRVTEAVSLIRRLYFLCIPMNAQYNLIFFL